MGYSIDCFMVPFGALVWYKEPYLYAYGPKGEPAVFLGAELVDGMLFKGCYRGWPLEQFKQGILQEVVVRTIAVPTGEWKFPAIVDHVPHELDPVAEAELDMDDGYEPSIPPGDDDDCKEFWDTLGDGGPAPGADTKSEGIIKKHRNRPITPLRVAAYGKSPDCDGCKFGTYSHSQSCRERFNKLLDEVEPSRSKPEVPAAPVTFQEGCDLFSMDTPITGRALGECDLERGPEAVAAIYLRELELGQGDENELSLKLEKILQCNSASVPQNQRVQRNGLLSFVARRTVLVAESLKHVPYPILV